MEMRNKIKEKIEDGMELLCKKVDPEDLKPGDHIYAYRLYGFYSHHGIYVGGGYVIHYTSTENKGAILSLSGGAPETMPPVQNVGTGKTLAAGSLRRASIASENTARSFIPSITSCMAHRWGHLLKNPGTCSILSCDKTPEQVIEVASKLLGSNEFGVYHVITNNCEHFATYCKTGVTASEQAAFYSVFEKKLRNCKEWL
ncbi:LOW QUALITY PROTEIN: phospholipase A and acyltransferase 3 [Eucalyptus grandis]|uniref:LOW QUALITY PROTEIN: phospholipase A and acyltransferase 3 n=1 Tax=Eucalyptus grandis TaxID=71139 RepID=UPI00192EEB42|nr:LOW QUALITY PROTEIN: phospholipase A and acyltransferase 3 [Eucalyptus grandis]